MRSTLFAAAVVFLAGCASPEAVSTADSPLQQGEMIVYQVGQFVDEADLFDLGAPADLGGTVLEGDPHISARIDYSEGGLTAGVFQATRGKVLIHFPFTEHATILSGEVSITDEAGNAHLFKPGDAYLIKQGSNVVWDVKAGRVQKSFFNRVEPADAPAPMIVYPLGSVAADDELVDLGDPADLGGTVVSGDVAISARFDYLNSGLAAGIFQGTNGEVIVDFPFTEHATILRGEVTLTDEVGATHVFKPGDSYLIKQGSLVRWNVPGPRVQKSFFNFSAP